jgi:NTE family protein
MKRALVLSGGGAKGAFQLGALHYIFEKEALGQSPCACFNVIQGMSVGALNGVMLAQNRFEALEGLWKHISVRDVYRGNLRVLRLFSRLAAHRASILDNAPLAAILEVNISLARIDPACCDLMFGAVSVENGRYHSFHARDFTGEAEFRRAVMASASIPLLWPPVKRITTRTGEEFRLMVDGSVRCSRPIGEVLSAGADEVVIINCNAEGFHPRERPEKNMLGIGIRMLTEVTLNEIFRQDVRQFTDINRIIAQLPADLPAPRKPSGGLYRNYPAVLIEPREDLGDAMDFSRHRIDAHIQKGYEAAARAYAERGRREDRRREPLKSAN